LIGTFARRALRVLRAQNSWSTYRRFLSVHPSALVDATAMVAVLNLPQAECELLRIGEGSHVFSTFSLLRPEARISVGARCQLGRSHFIAATLIDIGDDVIVSWGVTVLDSDNHSVNWGERSGDVERGRRSWIESGGQDIARDHDWTHVRTAPVHIGPKVFIGCNVTVLKGVTIGEGAVIGAGSVVTRDVAPWHVAAGNPCRELRPLAAERST
jgi:acetyltransferase-like isoleucine patch superfamily enzyme